MPRQLPTLLVLQIVAGNPRSAAVGPLPSSLDRDLSKGQLESRADASPNLSEAAGVNSAKAGGGMKMATRREKGCVV